MQIQVINHDWKTKPVTIKNKTVRVLSNNVVIPTWKAMEREIQNI